MCAVNKRDANSLPKLLCKRQVQGHMYTHSGSVHREGVSGLLTPGRHPGNPASNTCWLCPVWCGACGRWTIAGTGVSGKFSLEVKCRSSPPFPFTRRIPSIYTSILVHVGLPGLWIDDDASRRYLINRTSNPNGQWFPIFICKRQKQRPGSISWTTNQVQSWTEFTLIK